MKLNSRVILTLTTVLFAFASFTGKSNAAISYSTDINGFLHVTFSESVYFTITNGTSNVFYLLLEDAYTTTQPFSLDFDATSTATINLTGSSTATGALNSFFIFENNDVTRNDLSLVFGLDGIDIQVGDTFVLSPGTFSTGSVFPVPDNSNPTLSILSGEAHYISSPGTSTVPEPASAVLALGGLVTFLLCRRR